MAYISKQLDVKFLYALDMYAHFGINLIMLMHTLMHKQRNA